MIYRIRIEEHVDDVAEYPAVEATVYRVTGARSFDLVCRALGCDEISALRSAAAKVRAARARGVWPFARRSAA